MNSAIARTVAAAARHAAAAHRAAAARPGRDTPLR